MHTAQQIGVELSLTYLVTGILDSPEIIDPYVLVAFDSNASVGSLVAKLQNLGLERDMQSIGQIIGPNEFQRKIEPDFSISKVARWVQRKDTIGCTTFHYVLDSPRLRATYPILANIPDGCQMKRRGNTEHCEWRNGWQSIRCFTANVESILEIVVVPASKPG